MSKLPAEFNSALIDRYRRAPTLVGGRADGDVRVWTPAPKRMRQLFLARCSAAIAATGINLLLYHHDPYGPVSFTVGCFLVLVPDIYRRYRPTCIITDSNGIRIGKSCDVLWRDVQSAVFREGKEPRLILDSLETVSINLFGYSPLEKAELKILIIERANLKQYPHQASLYIRSSTRPAIAS